MIPPVLELSGVVKDYRALRPLRIAALSVKPGERVVTSSYSGLTDKDRLTFDSAD